jgi:hypothetical protein
MPSGRWRGAIVAACLILAGCVQERPANISMPEVLAMLQTGRPVRNCREACLTTWQSVQPQAAQLEMSGRWSDLAVLVVQTGYQDDLSLYYLGRAADGLGYRNGALSYYRQSMQLSDTSVSCRNLSHLCGGLLLPTAASQRIAAIDRMIAPPRRPAPRAVPRSPELVPAAIPEAIPATAPVVAFPTEPPPRPAVEAPVSPAAEAPTRPTAEAPKPPPPRNPVPRATLDYIEPPPVQR